MEEFNHHHFHCFFCLLHGIGKDRHEILFNLGHHVAFADQGGSRFINESREDCFGDTPNLSECIVLGITSLPEEHSDHMERKDEGQTLL